MVEDLGSNHIFAQWPHGLVKTRQSPPSAANCGVMRGKEVPLKLKTTLGNLHKLEYEQVLPGKLW